MIKNKYHKTRSEQKIWVTGLQITIISHGLVSPGFVTEVCRVLIKSVWSSSTPEHDLVHITEDKVSRL